MKKPPQPVQDLEDMRKEKKKPRDLDS